MNICLEKPDNEKRSSPFELLLYVGMFSCVMNIQTGAGGRTRTGTPSLAVDFESTTSTNSITPAFIFLSLTPNVLFEKLERYHGDIKTK